MKVYLVVFSFYCSDKEIKECFAEKDAATYYIKHDLSKPGNLFVRIASSNDTETWQNADLDIVELIELDVL